MEYSIKIMKRSRIHKNKILAKLRVLAYFIVSVLSIENAIAKSKELIGNSRSIYFTNSASVFRLTDITPKIFSPDEDGNMRFSFKNPNFAEVTIRIFDITGAEIKGNLTRETEEIMFWNGTDKSDKVVRGGIYIYQVEADGEVFNGTVVVVR